MVDRALIERAAQALADAAHPPVKVILFGSYARGTARPDSDVDFLVVESEINGGRLHEAARLSTLVGRMLVPADVVVADPAHVEHWAETPGTLVNEALTSGEVLVER